MVAEKLDGVAGAIKQGKLEIVCLCACVHMCMFVCVFVCNQIS